MIPKFKVGDKVTIVRVDRSYFSYTLGKTGVIVEDPDYPNDPFAGECWIMRYGPNEEDNVAVYEHEIEYTEITKTPLYKALVEK